MGHKAIGAAMVMGLAAIAANESHAQTDGMEKCYGTARAGANDGIGRAEEPGGATLDFQGDAWTWVPEGTCLTMPLPPHTDGTPRRGSLLPLKRDMP
jgi:uncharacterized membrane protein